MWSCLRMVTHVLSDHMVLALNVCDVLKFVTGDFADHAILKWVDCDPTVMKHSKKFHEWFIWQNLWPWVCFEVFATCCAIMKPRTFLISITAPLDVIFETIVQLIFCVHVSVSRTDQCLSMCCKVMERNKHGLFAIMFEMDACCVMLFSQTLLWHCNLLLRRWNEHCLNYMKPIQLRLSHLHYALYSVPDLSPYNLEC